MTKKTIPIHLDSALEATPIAMLVQVASRYDSRIYIHSLDETVRVNAKSIMGMMSLGLETGGRIIVEADGEDEQDAIEGIEDYLSGSAVAAS